MNTRPTPETDKFFATFADGEATPSHAEYYVRLQDLERERDEWKAKYIQQNKDLGCEQMDPNGTIWDYAKTLQRERDEATETLDATLSAWQTAQEKIIAVTAHRDEAREVLKNDSRSVG